MYRTSSMLCAATAALGLICPAKAGESRPESPPASEGILLSTNHNGKTVMAAVGKTIDLRLPGDRASGFVWEAGKVAGSAVQATGKPEFVPGANILGKQGGVFVFRFKAVQPGRSTIKAAYLRPGDKNKRPLHTFSADVVVKKD